jgi:hypothetical protein
MCDFVAVLARRGASPTRCTSKSRLVFLHPHNKIRDCKSSFTRSLVNALSLLKRDRQQRTQLWRPRSTHPRPRRLSSGSGRASGLQIDNGIRLHRSDLCGYMLLQVPRFAPAQRAHRVAAYACGTDRPSGRTDPALAHPPPPLSRGAGTEFTLSDGRLRALSSGY